MFSIKEKRLISSKIEELLLSLQHPEMPKEKPKFKLHVDGAEAWSFADIEPNWVFDDKNPSINQWNEHAREIMK